MKEITTTNIIRNLVIFAGPHKSASSSVQELFGKYSSNEPDGKGLRRRHYALVNWTWPYTKRRRSYLPRKGFAPLITESNDHGFINLLYNEIANTWIINSTLTQNTRNLILGSEEFDRFGLVPWSSRNGILAMQNLITFIKGLEESTNTTTKVKVNVTIVLNYRRPRVDQWISIWKQLSRKSYFNKANSTYTEFMCSSNEYNRIWEYLDCVANPLGFVKELLEIQQQQQESTSTNIHNRSWWDQVVLLDMEGITNAKLDVGHVLACEVLDDVHCPKGWLPGLEPKKEEDDDSKKKGGNGGKIIQNQKFGNSQLTSSQLNEIDYWLRQRDCTYREYLLSSHNSKFVVLHGETLWENCTSTNSSTTTNRQDEELANEYYYANTTLLLDLLQQQIGCGRNITNNPVNNNNNKTLLSSSSKPNNNNNNNKGLSSQQQQQNSLSGRNKILEDNSVHNNNKTTTTITTSTSKIIKVPKSSSSASSSSSSSNNNNNNNAPPPTGVNVPTTTKIGGGGGFLFLYYYGLILLVFFIILLRSIKCRTTTTTKKKTTFHHTNNKKKKQQIQQQSKSGVLSSSSSICNNNIHNNSRSILLPPSSIISSTADMTTTSNTTGPAKAAATTTTATTVGTGATKSGSNNSNAIRQRRV